MKISITVEGWGLGWDRWKDLITRLEADGYATIYKCDHFNWANDDHLETYVALTYLASHVPRVNFGTLVSPISFRDPVMLARQTSAIDDLSGGRMILGVGAGWNEDEHKMFGYHLGSVKERSDRFEEGLEVITNLIRSDKPATFEGQYFQLHDAVIQPRPRHPTRILIGGNGPKRTLPMVAKYADIWNGDGKLERFKENNALLTNLLLAGGRQASDIKRTNSVFMGCWRTDAERDQILSEVSGDVINFFGGRDGFTDFLKDQFADTSPAGVVAQFKAFEDAGCEEIVIHYAGMMGNTQLDIFAEHILPHFH